MKSQTQENLLSLIKVLQSTLDSEENTILGYVKNEHISIYDTVSNIKNYVESVKYLIFNKIIDFANQHQINMKEFNKINNRLNREFENFEELIDDSLPILYDRDLTAFRDLYFKFYTSLSMIYFTIKHL